MKEVYCYASILAMLLAGVIVEIKTILMIQRNVKFYIYVMIKLSMLITDYRAKWDLSLNVEMVVFL